MKKQYFYDSPCGKLKFEIENGKILSLERTVESNKIERLPEDPIALQVIQQLDEYFANKRTTFDLPINPIGTDFQKKVWKALLTIPYGKTASYSEIAKIIGNEKASRAVGKANSLNPICIIVPCHRVIGKNGTLTGYAGGIDMKQKLLEVEKINNYK